MALAIKYRMEFADIDELKYKAEISLEGYIGDIIDVVGTADPCKIQFGSTDDKFKATNGSGCTITFYNDGYSELDFFTIGIYSTSLSIKAEKDGIWYDIWNGWLNPEVLESDYSWDKGVVTITANDGVAAMDREKYFRTTELNADGTVAESWKLPFARVTEDVLARCFDKLGILAIYVMVDIAGENTDFIGMYLDPSNFVDEDRESFTKRQVVDNVLETFGLRMMVVANSVWLYDPCILAMDGVVATYYQYNKDFITAGANEHTYTKNHDVNAATPLFQFINGDQSTSMNGGFSTMAYNYSAYPTTEKLVPTPLDDIPKEDTLFWGAGFPVYASDSNEIISRITTRERVPVFGDSFANYGLETNPADVIMEIFETSWDTYPSGEETGWFCLYGIGFDVPTTDIIFRVTGGSMPKSNDVINYSFRFKLLPTLQYPEPITQVTFKAKIKCGAYYAEYVDGGTANWTTTDTTTEMTYGLPVGEENMYYNDNLRFNLNIKDLPTGNGIFSIEFIKDIVFKGAADNVLAIWPNDIMCFMDAELMVNGRTINDDDLEFKAESGIDFINSKTIDLNLSSARVNGVLDRGALINANYEQEINFQRNSFPTLGSLPRALAQGQMANYDKPYRTLNATFQCDQLLRNMDLEPNPVLELPPDISGVMTPLMIVLDTVYMPYTMLMFLNGTFDLVNKTVSGQWAEVDDANYTINEV